MSDVSLPAMRELQRLILRLNAGPDLATTLRAVVDGVVEGLGFGVAVVNLVHDDGDGRGRDRRRAAGRERHAARQTSDLATWQDEIDRAERWGALRYVPHTEPDNEADRELGARHPGQRRPGRLAPDGRAVRADVLRGRHPRRRPLGRPARGRPAPGRGAARAAGDVRHPGRHRDRQRPPGRAGAGQRGVVPARLRERTGRHVAGRLQRRRRRAASCASTRRCARMLGHSRRRAGDAVASRDVTHPDDQAADLEVVRAGDRRRDRALPAREALPARRRPPGLGVAADLGGARRHRPRRSTASASSRTSATGGPSTRSSPGGPGSTRSPACSTARR